jgi:hypothetical protein
VYCQTEIPDAPGAISDRAPASSLKAGAQIPSNNAQASFRS